MSLAIDDEVGIDYEYGADRSDAEHAVFDPAFKTLDEETGGVAQAATVRRGKRNFEIKAFRKRGLSGASC